MNFCSTILSCIVFGATLDRALLRDEKLVVFRLRQHVHHNMSLFLIFFDTYLLFFCRLVHQMLSHRFLPTWTRLVRPQACLAMLHRFILGHLLKSLAISYRCLRVWPFHKLFVSRSDLIWLFEQALLVLLHVWHIIWHDIYLLQYHLLRFLSTLH